MLNLTDEQKAQFYKDSTRKELILTTNADWTNKEDIVQQQSGNNNVENLNLYFGNGVFYDTSYNYSLYYTENSTEMELLSNLSPDVSYNMANYIYNDLFFCDKSYLKVYINLQVHGDGIILGEGCKFNIHYINKSGGYRKYSVDFTAGDMQTLSFIMPNDISRIQKMTVSKQYEPATDVVWRLKAHNLVLIISDNTTLLTSTDAYNKARRRLAVAPDINIEDYLTFKILKNEDIVSESFSLTESLCSQENLKFGLCESSNCQVSVVNNNYQLKGVPFHIFSKVYTPDSNQLTSSDLDKINFAYNVTKFDITTTNDFSLAGKVLDNTYAYYSFNMDVEDYADLIKQANYCYLGIDYKFKNVVLSNGVTPTKVRNKLGFRNAGGGFYYTDDSWTYWSNALSGSRTRRLCSQTNNPDTEVVTQFSGFGFQFLDENDNVISGVTITSGTLELQRPIISTSRETYKNTSYEIAWKSFNLANCYVQNDTIDQYVREHSAFLVPLGKFRVKEVRNQVSGALMKKTLTLYDDLVDLEQNAFNWYTKYMFGMDTSNAPRYGLEYTRQLFSSFYDYMMNVGYYNPFDFKSTLIEQREVSECKNHMTNFSINYEHTRPTSGGGTVTDTISIKFTKFTISNPTYSRLYKLSFAREYGQGDSSFTPLYYNDEIDSLSRGISMIYVDETLSDNQHNKYLVNEGDYFMISENCTNLDLCVPTYYELNGNIYANLFYSIRVFYAPNPYTLANGSTRLFYYDYFGDHEIFKVDSSITGRDVVRSLLEVTGCLFRLDRYKGKPEFVYCTKTGLYPSQTLYPADDLYPRIGHDASIYESLYISTQHEDYTIKNIGKIQILKNYTGNDTESNVQWTYTAPNTTNENTYVIDDNIFYSNAELVYEPDNMPEIDRMLANMYEKICDMGYTPQITKAVGLPFVECGDRIGVITHFGGFETFVYNRTLKGIQALFDTFESKGDEYISGINDF